MPTVLGGKWNPFGGTQTPAPAPAALVAAVANGAEYKQFGLENFGNTCYANSVLQALYFCHPFRELLTHAADKSILLQPPPTSIPPTPSPAPAAPSPHLIATTTATGRLRPNRKASGHDVHVHHGRAPTDPGSSSGGGGAGPSSTSTSTAAGTPPESDPNHPSPIPPAPPTLFSALRSLFLYIANSPGNKGTAAPRAFIEKLRKENELFRTPMHQDAHEFFNYLLNKIVEEMEEDAKEEKSGDLSNSVSTLPNGTINTGTSGSNSPTFVHRLFEGTLTSETRCLTCETVSSRDESFLDLSIDIEQNSSVTACLRQFSASEMLSHRNKFFCDACCGLQEAEKRMKIKKLPNVLALHLKRFKYQEDQGRYVKLAYRVAFPMELRLFNTVDEGVAEGDPERLYELFAVVVHIGNGPHHGHYVTLVKSRGVWIVFDDDKVDTMKEADVAKYFGESGNAGSAYVLYYQAIDIHMVSLGLPEPEPIPEPIAATPPPLSVDPNATPIIVAPPPAFPPGLNTPSLRSPPSSPIMVPTKSGRRSGLRPVSAGAGMFTPSIPRSPPTPSPSVPFGLASSISSSTSGTLSVEASPMTSSPSTSTTRTTFSSLRHSASATLRPKAVSTTDREMAQKALALISGGGVAGSVSTKSSTSSHAPAAVNGDAHLSAALSDREEPEKSSSRWPFKRRSKLEKGKGDRTSFIASPLTPSPSPAPPELSVAAQSPPPVPPLPSPAVLSATPELAKMPTLPTPQPVAEAPIIPEPPVVSSVDMGPPMLSSSPSSSGSTPDPSLVSRSLPSHPTSSAILPLAPKEGPRNTYAPIDSRVVRRSSAHASTHSQPHQASSADAPPVSTSKELRRLSAQASGPPGPPPDYPLPLPPIQTSSQEMNAHNVLRKPMKQPPSPEQRRASKEFVTNTLGALGPQPKPPPAGRPLPVPHSNHGNLVQHGYGHAFGYNNYGDTYGSPPLDRKSSGRSSGRRSVELTPVAGTPPRGPRPLPSTTSPKQPPATLPPLSEPLQQYQHQRPGPPPTLSPIPSSPSDVSTLVSDASTIRPLSQAPMAAISVFKELDEVATPPTIPPPHSPTPPPPPPPRNPARKSSGPGPNPTVTIEPPTPFTVPPPFISPDVLAQTQNASLPSNAYADEEDSVPPPPSGPLPIAPSPSTRSSTPPDLPRHDETFERNGHAKRSIVDANVAPSTHFAATTISKASSSTDSSASSSRARDSPERTRRSAAPPPPFAMPNMGMPFMPTPQVVREKEREKREKEKEKMRPKSASGVEEALNVGKRASRKLSLTGGMLGFGRKDKAKDTTPPTSYGR